MWKKWIASLAPVLAGTSLAVAQAPAPGTPLPPAPLPAAGPSGPSSGTMFGNTYLPAQGTPPPPGPAPRIAPMEDEAFSPQVWVNGEYLLWWIKNGPVPAPLITTGDPNDPVAPGALGRPGTAILFGDSTVNYGTFSGARLTVGGWLNASQTIGLEVSGFALDQRSTGFNAGSDLTGNPPLYIPIFRADLGREGSFTISDPVALLTGAVGTSSQSQLWGVEANALLNVTRESGLSVDILAGFRYLDLEEDLTIDQDLFDPVNIITDLIHDQFNTRNQFYGGQVGVKVGYEMDRLSLDVTGKVALGANHEVVNINGFTTEFGPGSASPGTFPGGVLTQPSNIGRTAHDDFAVIPEVMLKAGYRIRPGLQAFVGYDFLYWNQVVRPGEQIDRNINPTQSLGGALVGPAVPAPQFNRTDFWAQGVTFGLEVRY